MSIIFFNNFSCLNKTNKNMHGVGFEPTKRYAADLKSTPFDHSGNHANL